MENIRPDIRGHFRLSTFLGMLYVLIFSFAGFYCSKMAKMLEEIDLEIGWRQDFHSAIHWYWTVPVSIAVAVGLIWKEKIAKPLTKRIVNLIALILLAIIVVILFISMSLPVRSLLIAE